jgi:hypothetical protein
MFELFINTHYEVTGNSTDYVWVDELLDKYAKYC